MRPDKEGLLEDSLAASFHVKIALIPTDTNSRSSSLLDENQSILIDNIRYRPPPAFDTDFPQPRLHLCDAF